MTLWIVYGFGVVLVVALLWAIAAAKGRPILRASFAALAIAFTTAAPFGIDDMLGSPRPGPLPERFQLLAFAVDQPTVFVWTLPEGADQPIGFRIPYEEQMAGELASAAQDIADGVPVYGEADQEGGVAFYSVDLAGLPPKS